jgi:hypothetical protein
MCLTKELNNQLLKYTAGTAIFCPQCQDIMDYSRTVVATPLPSADKRTKTIICCGKCWDKTLEKLGKEESDIDHIWDILDGRKQ